MNAKKFMRLGVMLMLFMVFVVGTAFSATWYVNSTNGDDLLNDGKAPTQGSVGVGPFMTIAKAISSAADGDVISVAAGTYGEATVSITKSVTIISTTFQASSTATITNGVTMNGANKTASLGRAADGSVNFNLGTTVTALTLTAGTLNVDAQTTIGSGATVTRTNGGLTGTPTTTNVNVTYGAATGSIVASTEVPASLGTGTLTVSNTGNTVTFPNSIALTGAGAVTVTAGATFSGNLSLAQGSIQNTGTGTLAIAGTVTFSPADATAPGMLINQNTGTLTVTGAVTVKINTVAPGTSVDNQNAGAGTMTLSGGVVFTQTGTTDPAGNLAGLIRNGGTGTMTVAGVTVNGAGYGSPVVTRTPAISATNASTGNLVFSAPVNLTAVLTNAAAGTVKLAGGTVGGNVVNATGGTVELTASTTFAADLDNTGSTVKLGANTLTLSKATAVYTSNAGSKIISATAATVGSGILAVTNGSATLAGELPNVVISKPSTISAAAHLYGNLSANDAVTVGGVTIIEGTLVITSGTFTVNATTTVKQTATMNGGGITLAAGLEVDGNYSQALGTLTLNAQTFTAKGNVSMTGGTVVPGTGNILLNSGTAPQLFSPIPNIALYDLTINSTGQTVTLGASFIINHNVAITAGTLELSTFNIRMQGAGGTFNNATGYRSSGNGTLIFEAAGIISGAGVFSNLDVRTGGATTVQMASNITFSGNLYLRSGDLDINSFTLTLSNSLVRPAIYKNVAPTAGTAKIVDIATGGSIAFAAGTDYDLQWFGDADWPAASFANEWQPTKLHNLTVATGTGARTVTVPAAAITITGNLVVNAGQTLNLNGQTLTASTAAAAHQVPGTVANGTLDLTGANETVTGSTVAADAATVNNLTIDGTGASITNLKTISGNLTVNKGGASIVMNTTTAVITGNVVVATSAATDVVTLTMAATTSTMGGALTVTQGALTLTRGGTGQQTIVGLVTLTAGSLTLGTSLDVTAGTAQVNGSIILGANNYQDNGGYTRTGTGTVTGTGKLVINAVAVAPGTSFNVANVEFKGGASTTAAMEVSNTLIQTSGATTLGADLTVSAPTFTFTAGSFAGAGKLLLTGATTTITAAANMSVNGGITVNSTGTTILFRSTGETASPAVPVTFTSVGAFTQTAGAIDLGINTLEVQGAFTRVAGTWAMSTGLLKMNNAGGNLTPGVGMSIPNLTVASALTIAGTDNMTVTGIFAYAAAVTLGADGKIILASGSTIDVTNVAAALDKLPTFPADNNLTVIYDAVYTTAKELPAIVQVLTVNAATTLSANVTVLGNLNVAALLNATANSKTVTMGDGATLVMNAGGSLDKAVSSPSGILNIKYNGVAATTNFDWPASANIGLLTIAANTNLHANRTVVGNISITGGAFDLKGFTLTVQGNVTVATAAANPPITSTVAGANLTFSGALAQALTLAANYAVPANVAFNVSKTAGSSVTLSGANLDFATNANTLNLVSGVIDAGTRVIILQRPAGAPVAVPYNQTAGVVVGKVRYGLLVGDGAATAGNASPGVYTFPVGTSTNDSRPLTIGFTPNYVVLNTTNLDVQMVNSDPLGIQGLPVVESATLKIGGYPKFFWRLIATPSMLATQQFDIGISTKANIGYPYDLAENLRLLRRQDGDAATNAWGIQGTAASYASGNYIQVVGGDSVLFVRASSTIGGIVQQGTLLTIGVPTRKPAFTAPVALVDTIDQIGTLTVVFTANPQNIGEQAALALVGTVTGATLGATTQNGDGTASATLTYKPTYATAPGVVAITVRATNGSGLTSDITINVLVVHSPGVPVWTAAPAAAVTITDGVAYTTTFAVSVQAGDTAVFSAVTKPSNATINATTGAFAWTPFFAQAGANYTVKIRAANKSNATLFTDTTITFTVNHRYPKGDADGSGTVGPLDASLVLRMVVHLVPVPTDSALVWAADADANGTIQAYDGALILQYLAGIITALPPTSKAPMAQGELSFGKLGQNANVLSLPLRVAGASNIYSFQFTANIGSLEVDALKANLPKDWSVFTKTENGKLMLAAAGLTPISDGDLATISFKSQQYQEPVHITADALLNASISQSLETTAKAIPTQYALENNYPNPFNPTTTIRYALPQDSRVNVTIYNIQGQIVRTLVNADQQAGYFTIQWDGRSDAGSSVASGIYIYRINAGSFVSAKKMVMLK